MRIRIMSVVLIAGIFLLALGQVALAEEPRPVEEAKPEKYKAFDLGEVVITATKTERLVEDTSASVSVITEDEIEASNATSVMDIIGTLPGVFVKKQETFGRSDINIRGIGQNGRRIMVLIDGRPVKVGLFGCTVTHSLPLDNVERIEVIRGPASVLYGTDALGGVINIITKEAEKKFEADLTASYGTHDTQQYLLQLGGKYDTWDYYLTADKKKSDGHRENGGYDGLDYTAKLGYLLTENIKAILTGKYFNGEKEQPGSIIDPTPDDRQDYERAAGDLTIKGNFDDWDASLKLYENYGHHRFWGTDNWHHKDYTYGTMLKYSNRFWENNELVAGIDYRWQEGKRLPPQEPGEWDKWEIAPYLLDEYTFWDRLILSLGGRYNHDSVYGGAFCPHFGAVYHLTEDTSFRGAINKAFRSPQLNELYMFPPSTTDLDPEELWNYEIGLDQRITDWLVGDIVFFLMEGDNLIEVRTNPDPPPYKKFYNTGKFHFHGMELGLDFWLGKGFSSKFFYSYLDTASKTAGRPEDKFDLILEYRDGPFGAYLNGQYVADLYDQNNHQDKLKNYFVANAKVTYWVIDNLQAFFAVDNIFNEKYEIEKDYPMPGTAFTGGVKARF